MKIYYNDHYISINNYALKHKRTVPYLLRKFNKGGVEGIIIDGFRFVDNDNAASRWYYLGTEDQKIYITKLTDVWKHLSLVTVGHYATSVKRPADEVYSLILHQKMQCCCVAGIIFVEKNMLTAAELKATTTKAPRIHRKRK